MPELAPFPALRFTERAGDLSLLLAPPYDVISPEAAAELRSRSEFNCVRLILPEGSEERRYLAAAKTLESWTSSGILATDPLPRAYVYRQTFAVGGQLRERLATFAALRLVPLDRGEVLPHERTHTGPKKDRLALTLATRTQLSPIFMVAPDETGSLYSGERKALEGSSLAVAVTPDGARHELFAVSGVAAAELLGAAGTLPLLIADGHHRYETALTAAAALGDNVKGAFVLACIVSQRDPGLDVKPTHRTLRRPPPRVAARFTWESALSAAFDFETVGALSGVALERAAEQGSPGSFIVVSGGGKEIWRATPRPGALGDAGVSDHEARIAPVVFDRLVLRSLYGLEADEASHDGILAYSREPEVAAAPPAGGCGFVLPPVSLADVWATASQGGRLPPKSTYFEPKMPSGLLFRPL